MPFLGEKSQGFGDLGSRPMNPLLLCGLGKVLAIGPSIFKMKKTRSMFHEICFFRILHWFWVITYKKETREATNKLGRWGLNKIKAFLYGKTSQSYSADTVLQMCKNTARASQRQSFPMAVDCRSFCWQSSLQCQYSKENILENAALCYDFIWWIVPITGFFC